MIGDALFFNNDVFLVKAEVDVVMDIANDPDMNHETPRSSLENGS
jgi:hypothetical protein